MNSKICIYHYFNCILQCSVFGFKIHRGFTEHYFEIDKSVCVLYKSFFHDKNF